MYSCREGLEKVKQLSGLHQDGQSKAGSCSRGEKRVAPTTRRGSSSEQARRDSSLSFLPSQAATRLLILPPANHRTLPPTVHTLL